MKTVLTSSFFKLISSKAFVYDMVYAGLSAHYIPYGIERSVSDLMKLIVRCYHIPLISLMPRCLCTPFYRFHCGVY